MAQLTIQQALDLALQRQRAGQWREAVQLCQLIVAQLRSGDRHPMYAEAQYHLGLSHTGAGQIDEAIAAYRQAIVARPNYAEAHCDLGVALKRGGRLAEAIAAYQQAISVKADFVPAHFNLGNALLMTGQFDQAAAAYRQAIALEPSHAQAWCNLGNAEDGQGQFDEAIAAYQRAIEANPAFAGAWNNLGLALYSGGQGEQAIAAYRRAIALDANLAEAHMNFAAALLAKGDFPQGWEEYEWRWKFPGLPSYFPKFAQPPWDGSPLEGRTILLHAEQGLGDTLQFIRYASLAADRGGRIIVGCQAELRRLFQTTAAGYQIVVPGEPLPAFDVHCPLLSLPRVFGTTLANLPRPAPYLRADAQDIMKWRDRLAEFPGAVKVGLAWAGKPVPRHRSMRLADLAPLSQLPGVRLFSLQKGEPAEQAKTPPPSMELVDWTEQLNDFADTAALIANLDLVISVDTAVAHLAGAMGKPVWTLLPFVADCRWLLQREDSPWYPSMRLFRQSSRGDWDGVMKDVAEALKGVR